MEPILVELSPNRLLLDSNFDGYKLSLDEIHIKKRELVRPVDRILLNPSQYTLRHTKLYGLHNHLIGNNFDDMDSVYFVDSDWNICKTYLDPFNDDLIEPLVVLQIPRNNERKIGDYNVTLKFANQNTVVISDGTGTLYICDTGCQKDDDLFTIIFSDKVICPEEGFIIIDAVSRNMSNKKEELHVLLVNLQQINLEEKFTIYLSWVTFTKDDQWQQVSLKQLNTEGDIQYAALEKDCNAVYVVTDSGCKFTLNSDCPVKLDNVQDIPKTYQWSQNKEEIIIKLPLPENVTKELISVVSKPTDIEFNCNENKLLNGKLHRRIDSDLTIWTIENNCLEVVLYKNEIGLMWPELIKGDKSGEYIIDDSIVQEVHERLGHLCDDTEAMPQSGSTFTSQQVEECDFETDKIISFERLSGTNNKLTHKIHLGSHQVLLIANLSPDLPPALGIRYDVDVCLWQPQGSEDDFSVSHEGTLLAFGYVQASKQNRKFSVCPPDMSYSAVCESMGHVFIYRQKIPVSTSELRHRATGRKINSIAQQQVVNISNEEVIGIYATNKILYLLSEKSVRALKL